MELFYTPTSPYSRKILLVADHLGLSERITMTLLNPLEDKEGRLAAANPLKKIPTLVLDNGEAVYDSPLIAEVLFNLADAPARAFDDRLKHLKMQVLADGIMDAAVSSQMEKIRPDAEQSTYWQGRWQAAILRAVGQFDESMLADAEDWHLGSMSMACALDYLILRHPELDWSSAHPKTDHWYRQIVKKAIMIATDPK
ncbi:MAG: hypothetical protein COB54_08850 [Alphaproteobacteria bacterium]|nr:MAG: hypothetical protein COB54_08850 [Alphaproteobacteria bacterium]